MYMARVQRALGAALVVSTAGAAGAQPVTNTFTNDAEGWTLAAGSDPQSVLVWLPTIGNPPPGIRIIEDAQGNADFFESSPAYRGDHSAMYGGTLSYDIRSDPTDGTNNDRDVVLAGIVEDGAALSICINIEDPSFDWEQRCVELHENAGWSLCGSGTAPTCEQMRGILGNITSLRIRADYRSGDERTTLDNVVMAPGTPPCPADWTGDCVLNSDDYFAFLADFFGGDADFNGSGATDSNDHFAFLAEFFEGCP